MHFRYTAQTPAEAKQAVAASTELSNALKGFLNAAIDEIKPENVEKFGVQINASQDNVGTLVHVHMVL